MTNTFPTRLSAQLPAARAPAPHGHGAGRAGLAVVGALAALGPDGQQTPLLPRRAPPGREKLRVADVPQQDDDDAVIIIDD